MEVFFFELAVERAEEKAKGYNQGNTDKTRTKQPRKRAKQG